MSRSRSSGAVVANLPARLPVAWAAGALLAAVVASAPAPAQDAALAGSYNTPYGYGYGQDGSLYNAGTRDEFGNRAVVSGRILLGEEVSNLPRTLTGEFVPGFASGGSTAIGNQLNVIVEGDWNTVVIDSTQINNGDVAADDNLNGELDLND